MKKVTGKFPFVQSAELAAGRIKDECGGGDCKVQQQKSKPDSVQVYAPASQLGLSISPNTSANTGIWSADLPDPEKDIADVEGEFSLEYIGTEEQTEKAAHVLRSIGATNIHSSDA